MAKRSTTRAARASRHAADAHEDADVDGCDLEFHDSDATPDSELPPAIGGVETARAAQRRRSLR